MTASVFRKSSGYPGFGAITLLLFLFLYLPIAVLVVFSFNSSNSVTVWQSFSLHWYASALENLDLQKATLNTLMVASVATVGAVLIALPAALVLTGPYAPPRRRRTG